ncbi:MAG: HIT family protein [Flavobacteriales bacterium]|nr:HIT family protein [Flavobacteriales bacterium]|tara:strand:- start:8515 stop:8901 length:387 start_codon:yes stop_codon:yes gene_type:complete
MATIFSKIISGELPAHKIAENDQFLAFLDINPLAKGHTLVIPKKETDYIFDVKDEEYVELWKFAKKVAKQIEAKIDCERIGVAVIGLEVAHAHIHLLPINNVSDINFARPKLELSQEELAEIAENIRA